MINPNHVYPFLTLFWADLCPVSLQSDLCKPFSTHDGVRRDHTAQGKLFFKHFGHSCCVTKIIAQSPYHVSQHLEGLAVISLWLTHWTDCWQEERESGGGGERERERKAPNECLTERKTKTERRRKKAATPRHKSLWQLNSSLAWRRQQWPWDRNTHCGCQQSARLFNRWIRTLQASTGLKACGHVTSGLALGQLKGGGG